MDPASPDTIRFNVGGRYFEVSPGLLEQPGSMLARLASDTWRGDAATGPAFIDRDGEVFAQVLGYLRYGSVVLPTNVPRETFHREMDYYGLDCNDEAVTDGDTVIAGLRAQIKEGREREERERDARDHGYDLLLRDMTETAKEDALVRAADEGDGTLLAWLLAKGVNPDAVGSAALWEDDLEGYTPLGAAIESGQDEVFEQLLEAGADYEKKSDRWRPLMLAAAYFRPACLRQLLAAGADVNAQDQSGRTALHYVARSSVDSPNGDLCARLLLEAGADKDAKTVDRDTPLMFAAENNYLDVAKMLLKRGADISLRDEEGRTALQRAQAGGHDEVAALLRG